MSATRKSASRFGKSVRDVVSGASRYALLEGDCLELMPRDPPGTVDLILTDHVTRNDGTRYLASGRLQGASGATSGVIPEPMATPYVAGLSWGAGLAASGL